MQDSTGWSGVGTTLTRDEQRANARLIAAAPDLLWVCEMILGFVESQIEAGLDCTYEKQRLEAAIDKAQGE